MRGLPQFSLRSIQVGFSFSMRASFLERVQPLSCFSRAMARLGLSKLAYQTRRLQL